MVIFLFLFVASVFSVFRKALFFPTINDIHSINKVFILLLCNITEILQQRVARHLEASCMSGGPAHCVLCVFCVEYFSAGE